MINNEYNFNTKFHKIRVHETRRRFTKVKDNLDFDEFLAEVGVAQMRILFNQVEFDAIYQFYSTSPFFPKPLHLSPNII